MICSNNILKLLKDKIPLGRSIQNNLNLSIPNLKIPEKTEFFGHFGLKSPVFSGKIQELLVNNLLIFNI